MGADLSALQTSLEKPGRHQLSLSIENVDQQANIPITAIVGAQSGPTLLVLNGIHGFEHSPIVASQRLATTLEPEIISGKIIFVHIANMSAYLGRTVYTSPADGKNLNRLFPGNSSGTLSARIAFLLTDQLYPLADAVLDMHSGDGNEDLNPIWVGYYAQAGNPDVIARSNALAMAFGFEHIVAFQWELTDRADAIWAGSAAVALGISSIDVMAKIRRERFVHEYLRDFNATRAAERAGYKCPHVQGSRLLIHPKVKELIDSESSKLTESLRLSGEDVVRRLEVEATSTSNSAAVRVRALEILGRHLGIFATKKVTSSSIDFVFADL